MGQEQPSRCSFRGEDCCPACNQRLSSGTHYLLYAWGAFRLACRPPEDQPGRFVPEPTILGPNYASAHRKLKHLAGPEVAEACWNIYRELHGPIPLHQEQFQVAGIAHSPGGSCPSCSYGFPTACASHNGCEGYLHATLYRPGPTIKLFTSSDLPPLNEALNAYYANQGSRQRVIGQRRYELTVCCDSCAQGIGHQGLADIRDALRMAASEPVYRRPARERTRVRRRTRDDDAA